MDTWLHTLVALARFHQLPAEPDQIDHQFGESGQSFTVTHILQAAKVLTLKTKQLSLKPCDLDNATLPAIAQAKGGSFFIIARLSDQMPNPGQDGLESTDNPASAQSALIHDLREAAPRSVTLEELEQLWSGELIVVTRRQGLGESLQQKFDISWFIPSLVKYRKLFSEVLIASFFLEFTCVGQHPGNPTLSAPALATMAAILVAVPIPAKQLA